MLKALRTNFRTISNVLSEGIDADGGYLVPEEYDSRLIEGLEEENIFRKLGTTITTSGERKINIAATKPAAAWIDEGEALTFGDATFAQINLDAHKLHVAVKVTEELLYDNAFGLENYIIRQFSKALANAEEDAFLNGTGVGQPLGLLAKDGGAEIGVTAASATEITYEELVDLVYRRMGILKVITRNFALVQFSLFRKEIHRYAFLQKCITFIFLIGQYAFNNGYVPLVTLG